MLYEVVLYLTFLRLVKMKVCLFLVFFLKHPIIYIYLGKRKKKEN